LYTILNNNSLDPPEVIHGIQNLSSAFIPPRASLEDFTTPQTPNRLHTHTHTLFKNTQQTCMNKMQMTITKEKKITTHT